MNKIKLRPIVGCAKLENEIETPLDVRDPEAGESCFRILSQEAGDDRIVWDRRSSEEIREARKLFLELVQEGLEPYRADEDGNKTGVLMKEFDPGAEEVIFLPKPMLVGG